MRRFWLVGVVVAAAALAAGGYYALGSAARRPIVVGLLYSKTGPMARREQPLIDSQVMALEEINAAGGLLGRPVTWVVADGRSDPSAYAAEARGLIDDAKASVIFGCEESPCRKRVKEVVERQRHLLIYPACFEGAETSANIVYAGGPANQQVVPAVGWCFEQLKAKTFFLVGSDAIGPRVALALAGDQVKGLGCRVVGEAFLLPGAADLAATAEAIKKAAPEAILSELQGESNAHFYEALARAGVTAETSPVVSFTVDEVEASRITPRELAGHYVAWNYMQCLDRPESSEFIRRYRSRFGPDRPVTDTIVSAYNSVRLWAQAVGEAGVAAPAGVLKVIGRQSVDGPEGIVSIDSVSLQAWRPLQIAKARPDGQFEIVFQRPKPILPQPYPWTRSVADWDDLVADLSAGWDGQWSNPARPGAPPR